MNNNNDNNNDFINIFQCEGCFIKPSGEIKPYMFKPGRFRMWFATKILEYTWTDSDNYVKPKIGIK